jgi:chromosome segregation ATPase
LISLKERFLGGNNGSETYKESLGGTSEDFRDELDSLTNQKGRLENVLERLEEKLTTAPEELTLEEIQREVQEGNSDPGSMTKSGISQEIERTKKEVEELNKKRSTLMKALR